MKKTQATLYQVECVTTPKGLIDLGLLLRESEDERWIGVRVILGAVGPASMAPGFLSAPITERNPADVIELLLRTVRGGRKAKARR